ncbi:MAG TPA: dTDP-4-amino-4,6-dideoxygalactose transaminase [Actinomycetota bacterium]|nr:dTDP-4-amino-4,6-dideoxygalactose transaminase [Actinomycetota bacterium]
MIVFNRPYMTGQELDNIANAHAAGHLAGDGTYTQYCHEWLERRTGANRALLTHSCTAALEMAALLVGLGPGDEVIMPSFTFVSTANAVVLRGAVPVFVDVRGDTFNLDERIIEQAITERTKAIYVVHYAGVAAEMEAILRIAEDYGLMVVEDAAQAVMSSYRGQPLGSLGHLGAFSFHETKNVISGEGGALLCRDEEFVERAEILREKGTDRSRFFRGQVDKYSWVDVGSSYLPAEVTAAFLAAQLDAADEITRRRLAIWSEYHQWAEGWEKGGSIVRPVVPEDRSHNGHMYYLVLPSLEARSRFLSELRQQDVMAVFHYVPLHATRAGRRFGRVAGEMTQTERAGECLVRMPLWVGLEAHLPRVLEAADRALGGL